jgi:hypothetical protein
VTIAGAPGGVPGIGVTEFETPDGAPVPTEFVAVTAQVLAIPLTVIGLVAPLAVAPPGMQVAV